MTKPEDHLYEFGPFRLNPAERRLLRNGELVSLEPKLFDILILLVENNGHLLGKDELIKRVWPDAFVEDGSLTKSISNLRKALGEGQRHNGGIQFIETVPKRGYRFVATVTDIADAHFPNVEKYAPAQIITETETTDHGEESTQIDRLRTSLVVLAFAVPVIVALIVTYAYFIRSTKTPVRSTETPINSIAVLPFVNDGGDRDTDYLSDGLTESIIFNLSQLKSLDVKSRNSVFHFKGRDLDAQAVGRKLGVQAVLTARIISHGDRVSISVELMDVRDAKTLWGETYDRGRTDLFAMQQTISREICETLRLELTGEQQRRLTKQYTKNPDAYEAFLKGRYFQQQFVNTQQEAPVWKALEYYEQAIKMDPGFALAYAHVTFCYGTLVHDFDHHELIPKAKEAALNAVRLDDKLAEAHGAFAFVLGNYSRDCSAAEREFKQTIDLNPSDKWRSHFQYANFLAKVGRFEEAIAEYKVAEKLEPVLPPIANQGYVYFYARQYDRAIDAFRKTLDLNPSLARIHDMLGRAYLVSGRQSEAFAEFQKAVEGDRKWKGTLAWAYAMLGKRNEALKALDEVGRMSNNSKAKFWMPEDSAAVYSALGDRQRALEFLEAAYTGDIRGSLSLDKYDPAYDNLRSDPKYQDLLQRNGCQQ